MGGTLNTAVLSTPGMIGMMERAAAMLALEVLGDGRVTVGFEVCVKHVAGAHEGARCTAHAKLHEIVDGRKLRFAVEVREGDRTIGVGTHERRGDRAAERLPRRRPHPRGRPARRLPERARGHPDRRRRSGSIDALARTGLRRLEVTSFVRADVIPQLADGAEVLARDRRARRRSRVAC